MKIITTLILLFAYGACSAASLQSALRLQESIHKESQQSQQKIDKLSDQKTKLFYQYQQTTRQIATLEIYNQQLEKLLLAQQRDIEKKGQQLGSIASTEQSVIPLMLQMIAVLAQFIDLDLPFELDKRHARVAALQVLMDRADVSTAEKYQQIMTAFVTEIEYGNTISAYQQNLADDKALVNVLRIGRVGLFYQSLDGHSAYYWSHQEKKYLPLPNAYGYGLARGFRVAKKQAAPEFIKLPLTTGHHE